MPVHDWTRVSAGVFHDFHHEWISTYIEPVAVRQTLPDMPLFLEADVYIPTPLEATYQAAWEGVPQFWRNLLEQGS